MDDLEGIMPSEISQTERQILYDITYTWNLKNKTNCRIYQKRNRLTDMENELLVTSWEREGRKGNIEEGD